VKGQLRGKKVVVVEAYVEFLIKTDKCYEKTQAKIAGFWAETLNQNIQITKQPLELSLRVGIKTLILM